MTFIISNTGTKNIIKENGNIPTLNLSRKRIILEIARLKPKKLEYYIDTDEDEYFPLPKELRANISSLSRLFETMFPSNKIEAKNSISKDKSWSATEALASL